MIDGGADANPEAPSRAQKMSMAFLRKVPTSLQFEHKKYVYHAHTRRLQADGRRYNDIMPRSWFKDFVEDSKRDGKLLQDHTVEGVRSFIRRCQSGEEKTSAFNEDVE